VKKAQFTDAQIKEILNAANGQDTVQAICRQRGISRTTFYRWRAKARAVDNAQQAERVRDLEAENGQLKQKVALLLLDYNALRVALVKEATPSC
jgi:putative transposase